MPPQEVGSKCAGCVIQGLDLRQIGELQTDQAEEGDFRLADRRSKTQCPARGESDRLNLESPPDDMIRHADSSASPSPPASGRGAPECRLRPILLTEFNWTYGPSDPPHLIVGNEYLALARALKVPFVSVILDREAEENCRRLVGRAGEPGVVGTTKLLDPEILKGMREKLTLCEFGGDADLEMRIDVTAKEPAEAARDIMEAIRTKFATMVDQD